MMRARETPNNPVRNSITHKGIKIVEYPESLYLFVVLFDYMGHKNVYENLYTFLQMRITSASYLGIQANSSVTSSSCPHLRSLS
jgi:hypothetical protein